MPVFEGIVSQSEDPLPPGGASVLASCSSRETEELEIEVLLLDAGEGASGPFHMPVDTSSGVGIEFALFQRETLFTKT